MPLCCQSHCKHKLCPEADTSLLKNKTEDAVDSQAVNHFVQTACFGAGQQGGYQSWMAISSRAADGQYTVQLS